MGNKGAKSEVKTELTEYELGFLEANTNLSADEINKWFRGFLVYSKNKMYIV